MEKRTVLFVDDEEKILSSLKRSLLDEPYESVFANSGKEALEILKQKEVHVLVTDMRMPEMNGLELLKIVKEEYSYIIRMVLSGYADMDNLLGSINEGEIFRFITKPWKTAGELKTVVRQAIDFYELHSERKVLMNVVERMLEGVDPEEMNLRFVRALLSQQKRRLYEWNRKCDSVPLNS